MAELHPTAPWHRIRAFSPQFGWLFLLLWQAASAAPSADSLDALARMDLEDLMAIEVSSVTGTPQPQRAAPAALTVLTAEDIRASGVTSLPEALRLVPGLHVARLNAASWVVGARGMGGVALTDTRYLVMLDGRILFDPQTSSTYWDSIDVVLADIDRIEVIRGPGATLWGVNAMNGVINIVTRSAADTTGGYVSTQIGTLERNITAARYGAKLPNGAAYRIWAKYLRHADFENAAGASIGDDWASTRVGFRYDHALSPDLSFTAHGDAYRLPVSSVLLQLPVPGEDRSQQLVDGSNEIEGGYALARLQRQEGNHGWAAQAYLDHSRRDTPRARLERQTLDVDFRNWFRWHPANESIWGLRLNHAEEAVGEGPVLWFEDRQRSLGTAHLFLQNTTELAPDRVFLMVGSKVSHHEFVGWHHQPAVRLWWNTPRHTVWAAVSRPVRVPSRFEEEGRLVFAYADTGALFGNPPSGVIVPLGVSGNDHLRVEPVTVHELGHRWSISPRWMLDSNLFYNDYERLISPPPTLFGTFVDSGWGRTYGAEVSLSGRIGERLRLDASHQRAWTRIRGPIYDFATGTTPDHRSQLRTTWRASPSLELHAALYHADRIPAGDIDAYTRADLGVSWRPRDDLEVSLWGQNLLDAAHREATGAEVPRSAYIRLSYAFGAAD